VFCVELGRKSRLTCSRRGKGCIDHTDDGRWAGDFTLHVEWVTRRKSYDTRGFMGAFLGCRRASSTFVARTYSFGITRRLLLLSQHLAVSDPTPLCTCIIASMEKARSGHRYICLFELATLAAGHLLS